MRDHLLTPTPTEADLNPTPDGSNTKRRPGIPITPACSSSKSGTIPPKPQRSPSFILRQTGKSLLPVGSFKSSVKGGKTVHICRSQSLPMNMTNFNGKSFKRMDSLGGMFRIVPATPRVAAAASNAVPDIAPTESGAIVDEDVGEDIPEEEAVCRICMVELSEGSDTLKLECSCKGELALAHKDCAVKWFSIKGTRDCEAARNGIAALAISLPFSGILGLFSSLTTTSMVTRRYVWIYAAIQFLFVVFFTHLFYKFLHLQAVISIILATFAGFGVGMTGNSIIVEILRWRVRRVAPPSDARRNRRRTTRQQAPAPSPDQTSTQPSATNGGQSNAEASDVENPAVPQA
ncbi:hypothetical protein PR202_ga30186 [Eleusine coracana subsp. coracana]|uniref:RING-CH-type domain-containing protein n=1 Tax=Eleusine coracana subsp. coracana TaxID=191504 RepID=A0AAV5DNS6_ELECO|nr:hypothetical protein PR202_ga30186 [Eleusine coracana subsp. coracana]